MFAGGKPDTGVASAGLSGRPRRDEAGATGRFNAIRFSEFLGVNPRYASDSLLLQKSLVLHGTKAANAYFTQSE